MARNSLLEAIGYVSNQAAGISMALEQVFCAVMDDETAWGSRQNSALGRQLKDLVEVVGWSNTIDDEARRWTLSDLDVLAWAVDKRNRIVHDYWSTLSTSDTRVVGVRAARFKIEDVFTTTTAMCELGDLFGELHEALQTEAVFFILARHGEPPPLSQVNPDRESTGRLHEQAQRHWENMKNDVNTAWKWNVQKP